MIRPITDRMVGAHMYYTDIDRISKNIIELTAIMNSRGYYIRPTEVKDIYRKDDIIMKCDWEGICEMAQQIAGSIDAFSEIEITRDLHWENVNNIERLTLLAYRAMEQTLNLVCGDGVVCGVDYQDGLDPLIELHNAPKLPVTIVDVSGDGLVCGDEIFIGG